MKEMLRYVLCGLAIGAADVVPGVSGGTVAFITGVYKKLLNTVEVFDLHFCRTFFRGRFKEALAPVPCSFLLPLVLGAAASIFGLAKLILYLLDNHPVGIWSFFFGLILASIFMLLSQIHVRNPIHWFVCLAGAVFTWWLAGQEGLRMGQSMPIFFFSGFIAICAWILPGISGAFMLVLLGQYQAVLQAVSTLNLPVLLVFAAGCGCGLLSFARVMNAAFRHFPTATTAALIGLMAGSLRMIWPWRDGMMPVLPPSVDGHMAIAAICCLGGVTLPLAIKSIATKIGR